MSTITIETIPFHENAAGRLTADVRGVRVTLVPNVTLSYYGETVTGWNYALMSHDAYGEDFGSWEYIHDCPFATLSDVAAAAIDRAESRAALIISGRGVA